MIDLSEIQLLQKIWAGQGLGAPADTPFAYLRCLSSGVRAPDTYFIYGENVLWEQDPPVPDFWMHQQSAFIHR